MFKFPTEPIRNSFFTGKFDRPVIKWDVIEIKNDTKIRVKFVSKVSSWRQGLWLRSDTGITINNEKYNSVCLWQDLEPETVDLIVHTNDGKLNLYNVWDKGRHMESQSYTSGMLIEIMGTKRKYSCTDFGLEPNFTKLVFELEIDPKSYN